MDAWFCVKTCVKIQMGHKLGQQTSQHAFPDSVNSATPRATYTKPCVNCSSPFNMYAGALAQTVAFRRQMLQRDKSEMNGDLVTFWQAAMKRGDCVGYMLLRMRLSLTEGQRGSKLLASYPCISCSIRVRTQQFYVADLICLGPNAWMHSVHVSYLEFQLAWTCRIAQEVQKSNLWSSMNTDQNCTVSSDKKTPQLGDKGTAKLTLHFNPTCNMICTADAKGWATHKQRSLATWGAIAGVHQGIRPASKSQALHPTFSPLLLSYLILSELSPAGPSLRSVSGRLV